MNQTVLDAIDAEIAQLTQTVPTPAAPLGYGTDLSCVSDLADDLAEVDPNSVKALGEALVRRLTSPRGSLPDDPDYGLDVRAYCSRATMANELRDLSGLVRLEMLKDDRVSSVTVSVTQSAPNTLDVTAMVTPGVLGIDNFKLTFAVSADGSVAVEQLG